MRLENDTVEYKKRTQIQDDDLKKNVQPLSAPKVVKKTNLFGLLDIKIDFLPLPLLYYRGHEFEQRWDEFAKTENFYKKMAEVTLWWFGKSVVRISLHYLF